VCHNFFLSRIMLGFTLALVMGVLLAGLSAAYDTVRYIFAPLFNVIKAVPVASFIILALLWVRGGNLSVCISFLMVLPIIYNNMLAGFTRVDKSLLEMAAVFRLSNLKKIKYIYIPQVLPYFTAACTTSLGLCWKSGIAAEVIGMPRGSMGNRLYETKLYMDTPEMFAWTVVIVIISFVVEKGFLWMLDKITARITDGFL
ncbi:MAG: ABC transporter permease subunit, partial [Oscillospiraceae bacterium]|nr:ABC transporter permease subunit [Oscillospiraceae bacterium]